MSERKFNEKCPRCSKVYSGYPALSRADNRTDICPPCGTEEALFCFTHSKEEFFIHSNMWMKEAGLIGVKLPKEND